jgi:hypothetical protein
LSPDCKTLSRKVKVYGIKIPKVKNMKKNDLVT